MFHRVSQARCLERYGHSLHLLWDVIDGSSCFSNLMSRTLRPFSTSIVGRHRCHRCFIVFLKLDVSNVTAILYIYCGAS